MTAMRVAAIVAGRLRPSMSGAAGSVGLGVGDVVFSRPCADTPPGRLAARKRRSEYRVATCLLGSSSAPVPCRKRQHPCNGIHYIGNGESGVTEPADIVALRKVAAHTLVGVGRATVPYK